MTDVSGLFEELKKENENIFLFFNDFASLLSYKNVAALPDAGRYAALVTWADLFLPKFRHSVAS